MEGKVYSDQTGRFPHTSNRGMKYVMVFYVYDANYVCGIPMKNRSTDEFMRVYRDMYSMLKSKGYSPKLHKIDNETSKEVEKFIAEQHTKLQYAPPHIHRQNAAERGIQTWKIILLQVWRVLIQNFQLGCGVGLSNNAM